MKLTCFVVIAVMIVAVVPAFSQTQQGQWEFAVSGTFSSFTFKAESGAHTSESDPQNLFSLLFRPGFFVIDGLEIQPEIFWGAATGEPPSYSFSGNVAYNYLIPGTHVAPFVLAGYGVGNGVPMLERMLGRGSDEFNISVLNLGAGVKAFASKSVALTAEYRYQRFGHEVNNSPYPSTDYTYNFHNVFVGISVFLP